MNKIVDVDIMGFLKHIIYGILGHEEFNIVVDANTDKTRELVLLVKVDDSEYTTMMGKGQFTRRSIERIINTAHKRRQPIKYSKIHIVIVRKNEQLRSSEELQKIVTKKEK